MSYTYKTAGWHLRYSKKNIKYENQDQQGKAAFNLCKPKTIQHHRITDKEPSRTPNKKKTGYKAKLLTYILQNNWAESYIY
jgi:hypothetical protein